MWLVALANTMFLLLGLYGLFTGSVIVKKKRFEGVNRANRLPYVRVGGAAIVLGVYYIIVGGILIVVSVKGLLAVFHGEPEFLGFAALLISSVVLIPVAAILGEFLHRRQSKSR